MIPISFTVFFSFLLSEVWALSSQRFLLLEFFLELPFFFSKNKNYLIHKGSYS